MKCALIALLALPVVALADHHGKGTPIFDGKDFSGWKVPEGNIWWSVTEGNIVAKSGPKKRGSILI